MKTYSIYKITNLLNRKSYIGASTHPHNRLISHRHTNPHFFEGDGYSFQILAKNLSKEEAGALEHEFVDAHKTLAPDGFNKRSGGYKGYLHERDTRQKMSENYARIRKKKPRPTEEQLAKLHAGRDASYAAGKHPMIGRKHSDETKAKISKANSGNKYWEGKKHTADAIKKMQIAARNRVPSPRGPMSEKQKKKISAAKLANGKAHAAANKGWETRRARAANKPIV